MTRSTFILDTEIGPISHHSSFDKQGYLCELSLHYGSLLAHDSLPLAAQALKAQLEEYYQAERQEFDIPVADMDHPVYRTLRKTSAGEQITYSKLAIKAGYTPGHARYIGSLMARNPISIIYPCHRVILASGDIGQYAWGIKIKQYLLDLEKRSYAVTTV